MRKEGIDGGAPKIETHRVHIKLADPPPHPFPTPPQPEQPQAPRLHAPMVYVYEKQRWEYKIIVRSAMTEEELNALGAQGWELVGVVAFAEKTQFYLKRMRA